MTQSADLHIHTCFSDGADTPEEIVAIALEKGLKSIALTDHDILDGIVPAFRAARGTGLDVIAGVELSSDWHGADIHILGYCFDVRHPFLTERLRIFQEARAARVKEMASRLRGLGMDISDEDVFAVAGSGAAGRPHVAKVLVNKGYASSMDMAFQDHIAEGRPAYVRKFKQTPYEAIDLIHQAGGVAVMAHPAVTLKDELIAGFVKAGLDGLEVYYPNTSRRVVGFYEGIAEKYGLLKTGGSDTHGRYRQYSPVGIVRVDAEVVERMKEMALKRGGCRGLDEGDSELM